MHASQVRVHATLSVAAFQIQAATNHSACCALQGAAETVPDMKQPCSAEDVPGMQAASFVQTIAHDGLGQKPIVTVVCITASLACAVYTFTAAHCSGYWTACEKVFAALRVGQAREPLRGYAHKGKMFFFTIS